MGNPGVVYLFVKHRGGLVCWRPTQALSTTAFLSFGPQWMNCPRGVYERDEGRKDMSKKLLNEGCG